MTENELPEPQEISEAYYELQPGLFLDTIIRRNNNTRKPRNFIVAVTGDPGSNKTYWTLYWAEKHEEKANNWTFNPETQIVFNPEGFWVAIDTLPTDQWHDVVWDDPTGEYSYQDWMLPLAKTVTSFIQTSSRYRKKNIWFPVPLYEMLPKGTRRVTGYEAMMTIPNEPVARLHRNKPNRYGTSPEVWKDFLYEVTGKIPKCAPQYESMRNIWTKGHFTKDKFQTPTLEDILKKKEAEKPESLTDKTYDLVLRELLKTDSENKIYDFKKDRVTANRIIGGFKVSRKVADEVLQRIVYEYGDDKLQRPEKKEESS